jgi:hypothetical protein
MIYPIIVLYACVVITAEVVRKLVKTLSIQGQARKLAKI